MRFVFFIVLLFLTGCQSNAEKLRTVDMYNVSGDMIGTVALSEQADGVQLKVKLEGLEPGFHGIHVHEYPKCEAPDFTTAGNHYNPEGNEHGLMHPEGSHLGDLPNIEADDGGLVDAELMLPEATLMEGKNSLLKEDGTSIVIQQGPDDGLTQPGGNGGQRIVCGELKTNPDEEDSEESPTDPTEFNEDQEE
ncbi:superoxide dismutase family protein [Oceanobacillus manasiensis]|uniref:superoxide dismutase family protein n=1 Tax=Oceanobacillus manasiensis TaxID=586413 RepID=UPI0005A89120|nr:superoxide dismutase family protein [Oceanobacillus manasiensis]